MYTYPNSQETPLFNVWPGQPSPYSLLIFAKPQSRCQKPPFLCMRTYTLTDTHCFNVLPLTHTHTHTQTHTHTLTHTHTHAHTHTHTHIHTLPVSHFHSVSFPLIR